MRRFCPLALLVFVAPISGCGQHDGFDSKDGIATSLDKAGHAPKSDRPTSAMTRLDELRANHGRVGPVSK